MTNVKNPKFMIVILVIGWLSVLAVFLVTAVFLATAIVGLWRHQWFVFLFSSFYTGLLLYLGVGCFKTVSSVTFKSRPKVEQQTLF